MIGLEKQNCLWGDDRKTTIINLLLNETCRVQSYWLPRENTRKLKWWLLFGVDIYGNFMTLLSVLGCIGVIVVVGFIVYTCSSYMIGYLTMTYWIWHMLYFIWLANICSCDCFQTVLPYFALPGMV